MPAALKGWFTNPLASRWTGLAAGLLTEIAAGVSYLWGAWSPQFRADLNLSVGTLNNVNTAGSMGGYFTFMAGFVYDNYGPLPTMLIAALLSLCGTFMMSGLAAKELPTETALIAFAYFINQHANSWADTVAVAANVNNFPAERGMVVGLIKAAFGISAGILTIFYQSWFFDNVAALWRFLGIFGPTVFFLSAFFHKLEKPGSEGTAVAKPAEKLKLIWTFGGAIVVAVWITTISALHNFNKIDNVTPYGYATVAFAMLFLMPALPIGIFKRCTRNAFPPSSSAISSSSAGSVSIGVDKASAAAPGINALKASSKPLLSHPNMLMLDASSSSSLHVPLLVEDASGEQHSILGNVSASSNAAVVAGGGITVVSKATPQHSLLAGGAAATLVSPGEAGTINGGGSSDYPHQHEVAAFEGDLSLLAGSSTAGGMHNTTNDNNGDDSMALLGADGVDAASMLLATGSPIRDNNASAGGMARVPFLSPESSYSTNTAGQATSERARRRRQTELAIREANKTKVSGASVLEAMCSLDFWLLFYIQFAVTGGGLVLISSLGNLAQSLGAQDGGQDLDVTLLSVFNCAGRLFFGLVSDVTSRSISKPTWMGIGALCMTASMLITAFSNLNLLYLAALSTGFSYGSIWALGPPVVADRFGAKAFATIYAVGTLSSALASFLLNAQLATRIYNAHTPAGSNTCLGTDCYRWTFLIICAIAAGATLCSMWLSWRLRPLYVGHQGKAVSYDVFLSSTGHGCGVKAMHRMCGPCCGRCKLGRALVGGEADEEGRGSRSEESDDDEGDGKGLYRRHDDDDDDDPGKPFIKEKSVFRSLTFIDDKQAGKTTQQAGNTAINASSAAVDIKKQRAGSGLNVAATAVGGADVDALLDAPSSAVAVEDDDDEDEDGHRVGSAASDRSHFGSTAAIAIPARQSRHNMNGGAAAASQKQLAQPSSSNNVASLDASAIVGSSNTGGVGSSMITGTSVMMKIGSLGGVGAGGAGTLSRSMTGSSSSSRIAAMLMQQQQQLQASGAAGSAAGSVGSLGSNGSGGGVAMSNLKPASSASASMASFSPLVRSPLGTSASTEAFAVQPSAPQVALAAPGLVSDVTLSMDAHAPAGEGVVPAVDAPSSSSLAPLPPAAAPLATRPGSSHPMVKAKAKNLKKKQAEQREKAKMDLAGGSSAGLVGAAGPDDSFYS